VKSEKFTRLILRSNAESCIETLMKSPAILFVVDGAPEIGGGHVMRALTLSDALQGKGATVSFAATPFVGALLDRFGGAGNGRTPATGDDLPAFAEAAADAARDFDAVVFDHFRLGAREHYRIAGGRPSMAVDDLADRRLGVDMVLDVGPDRTGADYEGLVEPDCRLLLGPGYALVRKAFVAGRQAALERRSAHAEVSRVLVSMGLTDVGGVTARVVDRIMPRLGEARLDVVLGSGADSLAAMQRLASRDPRVELHVETDAMAELCALADLAVGAGGSSTWERCVMGLPSLTVLLADNQEPGARALAAGAASEIVDARAADFEAAFDRAFTGLMRSTDRRDRMGKAAASLCDGQGAERAACAFLDLISAGARN